MTGFTYSELDEASKTFIDTIINVHMEGTLKAMMEQKPETTRIDWLDGKYTNIYNRAVMLSLVSTFTKVNNNA